MARILIVDDDPDILMVVETVLDAAGHQVATSSDPSTVAALVDEQSFDAIVLDVMMPGLSGYEVLRAVRGESKSSRIPILFLSAHGDSQARIRGLREGADDFLGKPFIPEELVLRIERLASQGGAVKGQDQVAERSTRALQETLRERRVIGEVFLGRYQALEVIGEGAMGLVFRGWDPRLERPLALKTLRFETWLDKDEQVHRVTQLLKEATTIARFNHPNLVSVYDFGEGPVVPFMAMEFVAGISLADYLGRVERLAPDQTVPLALALLRGLEATHRHQVVHQDVKPGNVLLGKDGAIKLTDFGVARLVNSLTPNKENKLFGTPGFLPPEALQGRGYTPQGDLFSLGAVLYECLTGVEAFSGRTVRDRILKTVTNDPPSLCEIAPSVPVELDELVRELLAKKPQDRPTVAQSIARLEALSLLRAKGWSPDREALETMGRSFPYSSQSSMLISTLDAVG